MMFHSGIQTFKVDGKEVSRDEFDRSMRIRWQEATRFIGAFGEYLIPEKTAVINGAAIDVPDDVLMRGTRLTKRHGLFHSPYEYALEWAAYKLGKE